MRERITFVQKLGDSLEPSAIKINGGTISGPEVQAVREDRLTIPLDELPAELQALLRATRELHTRWVSPRPYEGISPLLARLPPGLHVIFIPGKDDVVSSPLCKTLAEIFGDVSCSTATEAFTSLPEAALQYYQQLDDLSHFIKYAKPQLCPRDDVSCLARLESLSHASSLDISYDSSLHALRITAVWPYQRQPVQASSRKGIRTEVGILSTDKPQTLEPHEIGISGLLTVLGQDSKPSPTMFTFASRHRDAESSFSAQFLSPTGLHPTLQLRLSSPKPPLSFSSSPSSCSPHAYLTLPKTIFPDKYQLSDPLFLASKNLSALRYTTQPIDLEAPAYVLPQWGATVLVELAPPPAAAESPLGSQGHQADTEWTAEIPLHLRYLAPSAGGSSAITVPYPAVFWACTPDDGGGPEITASSNPFDRGNLGYDGLFPEGTVFWHVEPRPSVEHGSKGLLVNEVRVPVLDLEKAGWVNAGTAAVVLLGFAWIVYKLAGVWRREGYGSGKVGAEKKRQ